jgi:hypothetical protein
MAFYLNNKRYVEHKKPDGGIEHREIMEYYMDSPDDVQDLPGRDLIDECSIAVVKADVSTPYNGATYTLMTAGWVYIGFDQSFRWSV